MKNLICAALAAIALFSAVALAAPATSTHPALFGDCDCGSHVGLSSHCGVCVDANEDFEFVETGGSANNHDGYCVGVFGNCAASTSLGCEAEGEVYVDGSNCSPPGAAWGCVDLKTIKCNQSDADSDLFSTLSCDVTVVLLCYDCGEEGDE